ncbi:MAG: AAA family ATPase [Actinomycetota bacterium]|jgi:hypothetical protein|nr:AAA family ATPase [Actinomycetota bacterium]MCL6094169.1 AAA family ATPase [Actinomycetota bacterium]MDA8167074.1 AAA family ATPase [Actinomycetota bacterium]
MSGADIRQVYEAAAHEEGAAAQADTAPPVGVLMSEVIPERVSWLWPGLIPQGKLTVLDGDPGQGKSTLAFNIAARVSRGHAMPDSSGGGEPAGVVILSAEDGLGDTIRPRLEAAGADLAKINSLPTCPDDNGGHPPVLPDDLEWIEKAIERVDAKLVIIDPLMAYLSSKTNAHRDQDVRRALARMADLAEETGAAILVIRHLNKMSGGSALYRGGGSIGIIGAARSGLLVGRDPGQEENGEGRVLASTKCNLAAKPESLSFHLEAAEVNGIPTSRIVWDGASSHDANTLLAQVDDSERGALEEAAEVLKSILEAGQVPADEVKKQYRQAGISDATARRAKDALKVKSIHPVIPGPWYWELPRCSQNPQDAQDSHNENLEHLEHLGEPESSEKQTWEEAGRLIEEGNQERLTL